MCPLNVRSIIMSQKNFKIEEIMVVRFWQEEESSVVALTEASTKALMRDGETTLLFGTRRTRAKANNNTVSLSFSDPFYYSLSLSLFSRCQL